jgi:RimJ/RimL family protein N-acetyltransferase
MAWADVAISAGGSTCWELVFMGLPSIVIPIAENQESIVNELESRSIAKKIDGDVLRKPVELARTVSDFLYDYDLRSAFSEKMVRYINGNGPMRIIGIMCIPAITFRTVELSDCKQIWMWINDPLIRSVSFNSQSIPLGRHKEWFSSALANPDLVYYIVLDKNAKPFGQARFKIESKEAIISVLIGREYRGRSLGSLVIHGATEKFFAETEIDTAKAYIKPENEVSRKVFIKAGYIEQGWCDYNGNRAHLLIKNRGTQ